MKIVFAWRKVILRMKGLASNEWMGLLTLDQSLAICLPTPYHPKSGASCLSHLDMRTLFVLVEVLAIKKLDDGGVHSLLL